MRKILSLWRYLSGLRKKQLYMVLVLMIVATIAEVFSIGMTIPFLGALSSPEQILQNPSMQYFVLFLGVKNSNELILTLTILFVAAAIFAGLIRLCLLYVMTRFSHAIGADFSLDVYRRTLYQEYRVHINRNSSEVINGIITKTNTVTNGALVPIITLIGATIMLAGVVSVLFFIDSKIALISSTGFGLLYWGINRYSKLRLVNNAKIIADKSDHMLKALQEGLSGIRDVIIDSRQEFYCDIYRHADLPMRRASGDNQFIAGSPRYAMEAIGMSLIAILAFVMTQKQDDGTTIIPVLGALALGAQRLLPVLQQIYASYSKIKGSESSIQNVIDLLDQPLTLYIGRDKINPIFLNSEISLINASYRYTDDGPWIFENISFNIKKGECIGFIGKTGSGKSTLIDILMGLTPLSKGDFFVDDDKISIENKNRWQSRISHVPQHIYMSDGTIEENIAFGVPKSEVNREKVMVAADRAQVSLMIGGLPDGYQTIVGERGVRLSGGQRQRIGIARALYKNSDVLFFDEATSALDDYTEKKVVKSLSNLDNDMTIIIVAHRLTTLQGCNRIYELSEDGLKNLGNYKNMLLNKKA